MFYLGIDTSNYTTSIALYNSLTNEIIQKKKLLPVATGEKGIRQNDAVFLHVKQLPELFENFLNEGIILSGVGVSVKPRNEEGSYMPCFLAGVSVAKSISSVLNIPLYSFSHQEGHLAAAIYNSGKTLLFNTDKNFYAYHISGGTTEVLNVKINKTNGYFDTKIIYKTNDISAGQLIDRTGQILELPFPSGLYLDELVKNYKGDTNKSKNCFKNNGFNFSGLENIVIKMNDEILSKKEISFFVIDSINKSIKKSIDAINSDKPIIMSGGVMSCNYIKENLTKSYNNIHFANAEFSSDNAAGIAVLAALKDKI